MAKTRKFKEELVKIYREKISNSKSVFIIKPAGITANESVKIKKDLISVGSTYNVVKNSIFSIALEQEGLPAVQNLDANEHAVVFTDENVSEAAKVINNFAKDTGRVEIQAGIYQKSLISGEDVVKLAELPSKDVLIAQVLNLFNAPLTGFVNVINANTRNLVYVMKAIADNKQA
jgi:large subunit ribosomal protein L10